MRRNRTNARPEGEREASRTLDADDQQRRSGTTLAQTADTESPASVGETLSPADQAALAEAEATIDRGLKTFVEVGEALALVRDQRLYREQYGTFEAYCRERWGFSDRRARQLVGAAATVDRLPTGTMVPVTETQARELSGLDPEDAAEVMRAAHEMTGGHITASAIRQARRQRDSDTRTRRVAGRAGAASNALQQAIDAALREPYTDEENAEIRRKPEGWERNAAEFGVLIRRKDRAVANAVTERFGLDADPAEAREWLIVNGDEPYTVDELYDLLSRYAEGDRYAYLVGVGREMVARRRDAIARAVAAISPTGSPDQLDNLRRYADETGIDYDELLAFARRSDGVEKPTS